MTSSSVLNHLSLSLAPFALLAFFSAQPVYAEQAEPLDVPWSADFESDPTQQGWSTGSWPHQKPAGKRIDSVSTSGEHALVAEKGWWASPRFNVEPLAYYRLQFQSMVEGKAFWGVVFYDDQGKLLDADHYSSIDPSQTWQAGDFRFRARLRAKTAQLRFQAIDAPVYIDEVQVTAASRPEVAKWADQLYRAEKPLMLDDAPRAGKNLARSLQKLRSGQTLRIVMLGDSIVADTGNSAFDVLLERAYPGARVEVITAVRSGTGCQYYQDENRVKPYVLDFQPDLVIIGGVSHQFDPQPVESVVKQIRAASDAEILLLSDAVTPAWLMARNFRGSSKLPEAEATARIEGYRPALARIAEQQQAAYFDMRPLWDDYTASTRKHPLWLYRDVVHANARGKQLLARMLLHYLGPDATLE